MIGECIEMSFEVNHRDMLARLGRMQTKSGAIETPILFPVINPAVQPISPKIMSKEFDCKALITNAYILKKQSGEAAAEKGSDTKPPAELKTKDKDSKSGDDKVSDKAKTESPVESKKEASGDKK